MKIYCTKNDCTLAQKCLRVQKLSEETNTTIMVMNPSMVTGNADCKHFISGETIRFGKGFTKMLAELPRTKEDEFRTRMLAHYPRNKYFKMRKGEVLCGLKDQQFINSLLAELSITCDNVFDDWEERVDW